MVIISYTFENYSIPKTFSFKLTKTSSKFSEIFSKIITTREKLTNLLQQKHHKYQTKIQNYQKIISLFEEYIPLLVDLQKIIFSQKQINLSNSKSLNVDADPFDLAELGQQYKNVNFCWTSSLLEISKKTKKPNEFSDSTIRFELIMTLWCYAICLSNLSSEIIKKNEKEKNPNSKLNSTSASTQNNSNNNQNVNASNSSTSSAADSIKNSATNLRRAAGIFVLLTTQEIPNYRQNYLILEKNKGSVLNFLPELFESSSNALYKYCMSMVQVIAVHESIENNRSPFVIAQLSVQVYKLCDEAKNEITKTHLTINNINFNNSAGISAQNVISNNQNSGGNNFQNYFVDENNSNYFVDEGIRAMLAQYRILYRGIALQYLAVDAYNSDKIGKSVGYIQTSNLQLYEMKIFKELKPAYSSQFLKEVKRITDETIKLESKYQKENNIIFRESVTTIKKLEIPQGKLISNYIPYNLSSLIS